MDCANGVGALAAEQLNEYLGDALQLVLENTSITTPGALNNACGADYVKVSQKLPPSLSSVLKPGQRACSLDGDADRLIYYYLDDRGVFHMLDGDKIAALVAAFIVELVKVAGLEDQIKVGVVQTAYANGASTRYLQEVWDFIILREQILRFSVSVFPSNVFLLASNTCITPPKGTTLVSTSRQMAMGPCYFLNPLWINSQNISPPRLLSPELSNILSV